MFDSVAVVGATGAVGRIIRELLEARHFPFKTIKFLPSSRSAGRELAFAGKRKGAATNAVQIAELLIEYGKQGRLAAK